MKLTPIVGNTASGALRDPMQHPFYDPALFVRLELKIADASGRDRIRFRFI